MKTFLTIVFTIITLNVFATAQRSDKIIYKGQEYSLNCNPLEDFFNIHPDKKPTTGIISSALWRGYIATFEVVDNQLFLKDIKIMTKDSLNKIGDYKWESVIKEVFPNQDKIKIEWYSGLLVIPYGKMVNYVHMGYGSTYENYYVLEINKGTLTKEKNFNNKEYEEFKEKQFQAFKKTEEYKKQKKELQKNGRYSDEFLDSFLRSFATQYTTKILTD